MLAKRIIPCLDVKAGRVVKGINFEGLRDAGDPVEIARRYDEQGADEITFLDITASSDERDIIIHVVEQVAEQVFIPLTVGGGVRVVDDVRRLLNAGADKVSINTSGVQNPDLFAEASDHLACSMCFGVESTEVPALTDLCLRQGRPTLGVGLALKRLGLWRMALDANLDLVVDAAVRALPGADAGHMNLDQQTDEQRPSVAG